MTFALEKKTPSRTICNPRRRWQITLIVIPMRPRDKAGCIRIDHIKETNWFFIIKRIIIHLKVVVSFSIL